MMNKHYEKEFEERLTYIIYVRLTYIIYVRLTYIYIYMKDDLQLGILKLNCLLLKLYRKLRKMFLRPRRESNTQPSDLQ